MTKEIEKQLEFNIFKSLLINDLSKIMEKININKIYCLDFISILEKTILNISKIEFDIFKMELIK